MDHDYRSVLSAIGLLLVVLPVQDRPATADSAPPSRTTALPLVSYSDVTGLQYGATVFRAFRVGPDARTRPSSASAYLARTARGHAKAYLQLDRWSPGNGTRSRLRVEHISYPLPYFGVGAGAPDDAEEWYSSGVTTVQAFSERLVRPKTLVHAGLRHVRARSHDVEPGGALASGTPVGSSGSAVTTLTLGVVLDSRDNIGAPRNGSWVRVLPSITGPGSDVAFRRFTVDARRYRGLARGYLAAFQLQYDGIDGIAPFDQLPMIGADSAMRGYARGRYRDQHAMTTQLEVRTPHWRRVGAVIFAGAGTVAPSLSRFSSVRWFPTLGTGARYVLSPRERTVIRVDAGIGRGSAGISVGIGEAF